MWLAPHCQLRSSRPHPIRYSTINLNWWRSISDGYFRTMSGFLGLVLLFESLSIQLGPLDFVISAGWMPKFHTPLPFLNIISFLHMWSTRYLILGPLLRIVLAQQSTTITQKLAALSINTTLNSSPIQEVNSLLFVPWHSLPITILMLSCPFGCISSSGPCGYFPPHTRLAVVQFDVMTNGVHITWRHWVLAIGYWHDQDICWVLEGRN